MATKTTVKYESDTGLVHPMKVDSTRTTHIGTAPTGAYDTKISVKQSKSKSEAGIKPRGVRLSRILGTAPDTFSKTTFLPVVTVTALATSAFDIGATITINSIAWKVESKVGESAH